jgi:peptide/nickel transport system substrate-binding protein
MFVPLIYETLVKYDTQFNARPGLATSWNWSTDSRRLTLTLRPDVRFHSGRPFNSEIAKFNLERLRDPALGSTWRNYANAMHSSAPDPSTLIIEFDTPLRGSFDVLAGTFMADPETLDEANSGRNFVGTGPFRFLEWVPADHVTVRRNPDYWQAGRPYLDQVELRIIPDAQSALVWLQTGRVDWVSGVPAQDARRLQSDPTYQVLLTASGGQFYYVGLDLTVPAFADERVRQAFNYALNRPRIVDTALYGMGRAASIPWPQYSPGYDAAQDQTYTFDLVKARQLFAAAGWNPSTPVVLSLSNALAVTRPLAEIYQADLATIGVNLMFQGLDNADFSARLGNGRFGNAWLASMGFMNLSPATFLSSSFVLGIRNASHFESQRYEDLVDQVILETDAPRLKALLHEVNQIILDESFVMPIVEGTGRDIGPDVARTSVHNVMWDTFGIFDYANIWLHMT